MVGSGLDNSVSVSAGSGCLKFFVELGFVPSRHHLGFGGSASAASSHTVSMDEFMVVGTNKIFRLEHCRKSSRQFRWKGGDALPGKLFVVDNVVLQQAMVGMVHEPVFLWRIISLG